MPLPHSHYENLRVARNAPPEVIRAAYRVLVQKHHPDKNNGNPESARIVTLLNEGYRILSDPELRREHDRWIKDQELSQQTAPLRRKGGDDKNIQSRDYYSSPRYVQSPSIDSIKSADLDQEYAVFKRKLPYYLLIIFVMSALLYVVWVSVR